MGKLIPKLYEDGGGVDTIIAHSTREARKFYVQECDGEIDECSDLERICDLDGKHVWWMIRDIKTLEDYINRFGELKAGMWGGYAAVLLTYRQAIGIYNPDDIPGLFSTTEW